MKEMTPGALLFDGELLMHQWCKRNNVEPPIIEPTWEGEPDFGVCAYYRDGVIHVWPNHCAKPGMAGRQWSWPGYCVDRTPYGVIQHELGHHVDKAHGRRGGILAHDWRLEIGEPPLTGYCPDTNEWFAEIFRLFVTNPNLCSLVRPKTYARMQERWPYVAESRPWEEVLQGANRQIAAAKNKIAEAERRTGRLF